MRIRPARAARTEAPRPAITRADHDLEDHDRGLAFDLETLVARRHALKLMGGAAGIAALTACGAGTTTAASSTTSPSTTAATSSTTAGIVASTTSTTAKATTATTAEATTTTAAAAASDTAAAAAVIPEETGGPYPGDGTNGPNVLVESGIVRRDITSSFGSSSGTAEGVPLTFTLHLNDIANGGVPLAGAAVYAWHCTRDGRYSMYSQGVADQNYLRGVQESDANGDVTFTSIFPAAYDGRWPHIHFEIYPDLAEATSAGTPTHTSQLAFPKDVCDVVYATSGYEASAANLARTSLTRDMVFGNDGGVHQLATLSGSVARGYRAVLAVGV